MKLTVAMSVYNDAPFVGEAIDSMRRQTMGEFEFLIIDDRSTDGSGEVIAQKAAQDARIRVLPSPEKGRVPALNRLLAEATGDWLAIMDSDDVATPDRLEKQLAKAAADPRLGVIGCQMTLIDEAGNPIGEDSPKPREHADCVAALEDRPLLNHNAVLLRRAALLEIGGYRRAFRHAEDYDLWTRLIERVRFANLPDRLIAYRIYPGQVSSRHVVEQTANAAISWLACCERRAGRPDPTQGLADMPPINQLDAMFGQPGAAAYIRRRIVDRILYAPDAVAGDGWRPVLDHIAETRANPQLWRTSARLLRAGYVARASGLALALLKAG